MYLNVFKIKKWDLSKKDIKQIGKKYLEYWVIVIVCSLALLGLVFCYVDSEVIETYIESLCIGLMFYNIAMTIVPISVLFWYLSQEESRDDNSQDV